MPQDADNKRNSISRRALETENRRLRDEIAELGEQARRRMERDATLARAIKLGAWEWDEENDRPIYLSEELAAIHGMSYRQFCDMYHCDADIFPLIHPDDLEDFKLRLREIAARNENQWQPHIYEFRILLPDGQIRYLREIGIGAEKSNGRIVRSYGAVQDISDLKIAERKLREANESLEETVRERTTELAETVRRLEREVAYRERISGKLEKKNIELERFTYTVSHDLRSPLVTIKGFLDLLQQDIRRNDEAAIKDDIGRILDATDSLTALLGNLLELSRAGRVIGDAVRCDMGAIATNAAELLKVDLSSASVELTIDELPPAMGDAIRLTQVFQNLLENAIKFRDAEKKPRVHIGFEKSQGVTRYFVDDNGIGFEAGQSQRAFGLFERLDHAVEGSGIGLSLVKRIVEVHGGEVKIESAGPGEGCRVSFTLAP